MITITPRPLQYCLVCGGLCGISWVHGELPELQMCADITHTSLHEGPKARMTPPCFGESWKNAKLATTTWWPAPSMWTILLGVREHPSHTLLAPFMLNFKVLWEIFFRSNWHDISILHPQRGNPQLRERPVMTLSKYSIKQHLLYGFSVFWFMLLAFLLAFLSADLT